MNTAARINTYSQIALFKTSFGQIDTFPHLVRFVLYVSVVNAMAYTALFPIRVIGYRVSRHYGISTQGAANWLKDELNYVSREAERRADAYAMQLIGHADGAIIMHQKLAKATYDDVDPPLLVRWFRSSHPSVMERIVDAESFEQNHP